MLAASSVLALLGGTFACSLPYGGSTYRVTQASLAAMSDPACWDETLVLSESIDVDASVPAWTPVGNAATPFTGTFDGRGHTLSDLHVSTSNAGDVGLFGVVDGGTIRNVTLDDVVVSGTGDVGAVAGELRAATVENVTVHGRVTGVGDVGGLIGFASLNHAPSTLRDACSHATVEAHIASYAGITIGGAAGFFSGGMHGVCATGDVVVTILDTAVFDDGFGGPSAPSIHAGGLAGFFDDAGSLTYARAHGSVSVTDRAGGFHRIGGLVGNGWGDVERAFATGTVALGPTGSGNAGGLIGSTANGATVADAYATGDVTAPTATCGGLLGYASDPVERVYAAGALSPNCEGLVGAAGTASLSGFWDVDATGVETSVGASDGVTGADTLTLQRPDTYDDAGWSIDNGPPSGSGGGATWFACSSAYPRLAWTDPPDGCTAFAFTDAFTLSTSEASLRPSAPFDLTLTLRDEQGLPFTTPTERTVALTVEGDPAATYTASPTTVVLPAGATTVSLSDLVVTVDGAFAGADVTLHATDATPTPTSPTGTLTRRLRAHAITLEQPAPRLAADDPGGMPLLVTLRDADGTLLAGRTVHATTTLGTLGTTSATDAAPTVSATTTADGTATVRLRAGGRTGDATVTVGADGAPTATTTIAVLGAPDAPRVVVGDATAWLYAPGAPPPGTRWAYRIDDGAWRDLAPHDRPVTIPDLTNGRRYEAFLRLEGPEGSFGASEPARFVPDVAAAPDVEVAPPGDAVATVSVSDGRWLVTRTLAVPNRGPEPIDELWWTFTPPEGVRVHAVEAEPGDVTIEGDGWFWRGPAVAQGETLRVTVTLDRPIPSPTDVVPSPGDDAPSPTDATPATPKETP